MMSTKVILSAFAAVLMQAQTPVINAVVSAGYFSADGFATDTIASIYGDNLASEVKSATSLPLLNTLSDTSVFLCRRECEPLTLYMVSPNQVNVLIRFSYLDSDPAQIVVRTGTGLSNRYPVLLTGVSPGVFFVGYDCPAGSSGIPCGLSHARKDQRQVMRAAITHYTGEVVASDYPAVPGGAYVIWTTGLGMNRTGDVTKDFRNFMIRITPAENDIYSIGYGDVFYVGTYPYSPGLYQINFRLPENLCSGTGVKEVWLSFRGSRTDSRYAPVPVSCQ